MVTRVTVGVVAVLLLASPALAFEELILVQARTLSPAELRTERQKYMDDLVATLQLNLKLQPRQVKRMSLAAKGAVEYSGEADRATQRRQVAQVINGPVKLGLARVAGGVDVKVISITSQHPIWMKTLQRQLTTDQMATAKSLEAQIQVKWQKRMQQRVIRADWNGWGGRRLGGLKGR